MSGDLSLWTVRRAAQELGVPPAAIRRLIRSGRLPAINLGTKATRVPAEAIRRLVQGAEVGR